MNPLWIEFEAESANNNFWGYAKNNFSKEKLKSNIVESSLAPMHAQAKYSVKLGLKMDRSVQL